jgi:hypothetical protein
VFASDQAAEFFVTSPFVSAVPDDDLIMEKSSKPGGEGRRSRDTGVCPR